MSQILEQKKRKKKQSVEEIFNWCREQLVKADELYHRRKRDVILEVARRLEEAEFEQSKISQEIAHKLNGLIDASYVHKVLADFPQYKEQYRVKNAEKRNFSRNIPAKPTQFVPTDTLEGNPKDNALEPEETLEDTEEELPNLDPNQYDEPTLRRVIIPQLQKRIKELERRPMGHDALYAMIHQLKHEKVALEKEIEVLKQQIQQRANNNTAVIEKNKQEDWLLKK